MNAFPWIHRYMEKTPLLFWGWHHIFGTIHHHSPWGCRPLPLVIRHIASGIVSLFVDAGRRGLGETQTQWLCWWSCKLLEFSDRSDYMDIYIYIILFSGEKHDKTCDKASKIREVVRCPRQETSYVGSVSEALSYKREIDISPWTG